VQRILGVELRNLFRLNAKTEIAFMSGVLRVTIDHSVSVLRVAFDAGIAAWVFRGVFRTWPTSSLFMRALYVFAALSVFADMAYQIWGSETLEFGPEGLTIRTSYFGWERVRQYALDKCAELSWRSDDDREDERALECKVGWKKVRFGRYLSQTQAWEVLSELQRYLPDVAQKMGMSLGDRKSHVTRLGLS
jgi:hypothetical protein